MLGGAYDTDSHAALPYSMHVAAKLHTAFYPLFSLW